MNHPTVNQSVALRSEGQRLIAMRWSRFSRWRKTHPRGTNWLLLVLNLILTAFLLIISAIPQESPAAWHVTILCLSNLAFSISIFWRKKNTADATGGIHLHRIFIRTNGKSPQ